MSRFLSKNAWLIDLPYLGSVFVLRQKNFLWLALARFSKRAGSCERIRADGGPASGRSVGEAATPLPSSSQKSSSDLQSASERPRPACEPAGKRPPASRETRARSAQA